MLNWCKVFGTDSEPSHWKTLFPNRVDEIRDALSFSFGGKNKFEKAHNQAIEYAISMCHIILLTRICVPKYILIYQDIGNRLIACMNLYLTKFHQVKGILNYRNQI